MNFWDFADKHLNDFGAFLLFAFVIFSWLGPGLVRAIRGDIEEDE